MWGRRKKNQEDKSQPSGSSVTPSASSSRLPNVNAEAKESVIPDEATVNAMFEEVLEDMAIKSQVRDAMRMFDTQKKWTIIQQNRQKSQEESPEHWAQLLLNDYTKSDTFIQLRPVINASSKQWINDFVNHGGLKNLMKAGKQLHFELHDRGEVLLPCLGCLNAFMNNEVGIELITMDQEVMEDMAIWFDSPNVQVKTMVLKLLSVICLMGYNKEIINAFSKLKNIVMNKQARLFPVIDFLKKEKDIEIRVRNFIIQVPKCDFNFYFFIALENYLGVH